jgi:DNA repair exonuclease SbcCD nuclease subunit
MTNHEILDAVNTRFWPKMFRQFKMTWILPGNHDIYHSNSLKLNALTDGRLPSSHQIVKVLKPKVVPWGSLKVLLVPWICEENKEECIDALATHRDSDVTHVLGHFHIQGFNMGNGQVAEDGYKEDLFVGCYKSVASGHFHTLSKVYRHYYRQGEHRGTTIQYLGCPYEMTWGDWNDPKGFHFLDTETGEYEFVRNPYVLHKKIIYDDTAYFSLEAATAESVIEPYRDTFVRLIITKKTQPLIFDAFVDALEKIALDVKIIDQTSSAVGNAEFFETPLEKLCESLDTDDVWSFIKQAVDETKSHVGKKDLENFMRELYQEAMLKQT